VSEALIVLNPREIPSCIEAINALAIPKCWISYMYEPEAAVAVNKAIAASDFDRYVIISDDCIPTQSALDEVLDWHNAKHPVVTGYCNLDSVLPYVNLTWNNLTAPPPSVSSFGFMTKNEAMRQHGLVRTTFAGLALTCMWRDLWQQFPLHCATGTAGSMDYQLSWELQEARISIGAPVGGFVQHVKEIWNQIDKAPEKRLLIGQRPKEVRWSGVEEKAVA
jgi:hypothetical protein